MKSLTQLIFVVVLSIVTLSSWADGHSHSYSGEFAGGWLSKVEGSWAIRQVDGQWMIELGDDFKASKGPDVKLFLSGQAADKVKGNNATQDAVFIKLLTTFKGKPTIPLPADVDPGAFKSLLLHCEEYAKLWGASPLTGE